MSIHLQLLVLHSRSFQFQFSSWIRQAPAIHTFSRVVSATHLCRMVDNEARTRLDEVESRMSALELSVNTAVSTLMPKVDALLAERTEGEEATSGSRSATSASASTSLLELAKRGDAETLLTVLADPKIDVERNGLCTESGDTALHVAASEGHVKAVMVLVGAGAKVNSSGCQLRTPLHCAAAQGHLAVAQRLLKAGAKVDAKDTEGHIPLSLAAGRGSWELVNLLVQKGAKPDERAVSFAAECGRWDLVEFFLVNEALINACYKEGDPLIVLAAKANRWGMVLQLLEKGASATKCKDAKESALMWASVGGQADVVRELLLRGASSDAEQVKWALIKAKNAAVVWTFVDVVPEKVKGREGEWGLVAAGLDGRLESLRAFLKAGVNINATDGAKGTALHFASYNGRLACVRELLQRGADFSIKHEEKGNSPLHVASLNGHVECVRALLDAGASTTERNKEGKTPLEVAGSDDVRALLYRE